MTDEKINEIFEASWATHGDRVLRFARMLETELREELSAEIECAICMLRVPRVLSKERRNAGGRLELVCAECEARPSMVSVPA